MAGHTRPVFELPKAPAPGQATGRSKGTTAGASLRKRERAGSMPRCRRPRELPQAPDPKQTSVRKQGPASGASLRKRGRGGGINEIRLQDPKKQDLQVQPEGTEQALRGPPGPKANGRTILGLPKRGRTGAFGNGVGRAGPGTTGEADRSVSVGPQSPR